MDGHYELKQNLALISRPDDGNSTITENILLYMGSIQKSVSVRA